MKNYRKIFSRRSLFLVLLSFGYSQFLAVNASDVTTNKKDISVCQIISSVSRTIVAVVPESERNKFVLNSSLYLLRSIDDFLMLYNESTQDKARLLFWLGYDVYCAVGSISERFVGVEEDENPDESPASVLDANESGSFIILNRLTKKLLRLAESLSIYIALRPGNDEQAVINQSVEGIMSVCRALSIYVESENYSIQSKLSVALIAVMAISAAYDFVTSGESCQKIRDRIAAEQAAEIAKLKVAADAEVERVAEVARVARQAEVDRLAQDGAALQQAEAAENERTRKAKINQLAQSQSKAGAEKIVIDAEIIQAAKAARKAEVGRLWRDGAALQQAEAGGVDAGIIQAAKAARQAEVGRLAQNGAALQQAVDDGVDARIIQAARDVREAEVGRLWRDGAALQQAMADGVDAEILQDARDAREVEVGRLAQNGAALQQAVDDGVDARIIQAARDAREAEVGRLWRDGAALQQAVADGVDAEIILKAKQNAWDNASFWSRKTWLRP
jgi:hypothetical protein